MKQFVVPSVALLLVSMSTFAAAGDLKSGLQPGQGTGAFQVKDITGPKKGTSLCYR